MMEIIIGVSGKKNKKKEESSLTEIKRRNVRERLKDISTIKSVVLFSNCFLYFVLFLRLKSVLKFLDINKFVPKETCHNRR